MKKQFAPILFLTMALSSSAFAQWGYDHYDTYDTGYYDTVNYDYYDAKDDWFYDYYAYDDVEYEYDIGEGYEWEEDGLF